jgi:hypothetical protein
MVSWMKVTGEIFLDQEEAPKRWEISFEKKEIMITKGEK